MKHSNKRNVIAASETTGINRPVPDSSHYGAHQNFATRLMIPGPRHFSPDAPAPVHRGKGPKSYKRSDERIFEDICNRMSANQYLDASDIEVTVHNGEVLLVGSVSSRYEKRIAEDLGDTAYGVKNVENRLRIRERQ